MEGKSAKKGEKLENDDDKPDLGWVETVLGEMKSEFNKQLSFADFKTDYSSKLSKNSVNSALSKKHDKGEHAKSASSERKKSSPSSKSGGLKSPTGKSVNSKSSTSKTNNTKQVSKQVSPTKQHSAKQATTKSTSSSPAAERTSKNSSTRKSSGTDITTKGKDKKHDRTHASPSATTSKRGAPSVDSAHKKNDTESDVNKVGSRLPATGENASKAVSDKQTAKSVAVPVCKPGGKTSVQSSSVAISDSTRTKAVTVADAVHANSRTVKASTSKTAAASSSTLRPAPSTCSAATTTCSASTTSTSTINKANTGTSSTTLISTSIATTSCKQTPMDVCTASPTIQTVITSNTLRASTSTDARAGTTAILLVASATLPAVVSSSAVITALNGVASTTGGVFIPSLTAETAATVAVGSAVTRDSTVAAANVVFTAVTVVASSSTPTVTSAGKVAANAPTAHAATTATAVSTSTRSSTKPTVSAANTRTITSNSLSTPATCSSTVTSSRNASVRDGSPSSAAVKTGSATVSHNHVKEDKGNKNLHSPDSKSIGVTAKPIAGARTKTDDATHKDVNHVGSNNNNQVEKKPKTVRICDNAKSVTDTPVSFTSAVTSRSPAKNADSFNSEMSLPKHQEKVASSVPSLPCASESPKVVAPASEVSLRRDLGTSNSGLPKSEGPALETPINESPTSVQNQADSVAPSTVNASSLGSTESALNVKNEDPSSTIEEELFDDCSEKSEEITLLNRSEKVASDAEDNAPRLLITLKPGEAGGDSILSWKGCREVIGNDGVWSLANVETVDDNMESATVKDVKDKRSLRSQVAQKPAPEPEVVGVKRSARRRSRDYHRETVLQSAIARKEKSFSSLVQYDERAAAAKHMRAANRNSRQNMKNSVAKRAAAEAKKLAAKGAKAAQKNLSAQEQLNNLLNLKKARKSDIKTRTATKAQLCSNYRIASSIYNEIAMDVCSQKSSSMSVNSNAQTYTKTGKRRYKPYKGLRYSFSSNSGKKNKLTRHQRTLSEAERVNNEIMGRPMVARKTDKSQTLKDFEADPYTLAAENYSLLRSGPPNGSRSQKKTRVAELNVYESDYESDSSSIIDVGSPECKREVLSDDGEEDNEDEEKIADFKRKRFCYDKSALSSETGKKKAHKKHDKAGELSDDDMSQPIPEVAASSSKGRAGGILCYCQKSTSLFAAAQTDGTSVMYCQAMDALDEHLIGCAEVVNVKNVCLRRAGVRCPFALLCEVHKQRLLRHMCCPGCGIFCTQGKFVMCSGKHLYHRECQVTKEGVLSCPHCGEVSPPVDCTLTLSTLRTPVYLPELKPAKKEPTARMSIKESNRENIIEEREKGMTLPLDKEKLTQLVNTACSMQVVSEQETNTSRSMEETLFIAAKSGNAEKILQALASGIDANHAFQEANMGSALHIAASEGNLAAVHILLQSGAQIDLMDQDQNTPLILAAQAGHNAIVEYLIKAGASVTLKGGDGMTALHIAAKTGNVEACQYLLSVPNTKNNYVDTVDDGGWTPLVWATENCHADVARFLLKKRADPHIRDAEQNIALHWSAFSGCMDVSEMLINYGSEVNCANVHGDTPLHVGARQDKYDCVLMLLSRGARVDIVNTAGNSPLDCCVKRSNECYTAIKLNILLGNVVLNVREPSQKILCNDISRGREVNPIQCVNCEDDEEEPRDYTYVSRNCLTSNISIDTAITSVQSCRCTDNCSSNRCSCALMSEQCWYDDEGKLIPEFNYADAPMIFECNQCCGCNQVTCNNRVVQHGYTARFQLFRTQRRGWGVRTLTAISKGSFVCEYIGEIITDCEADNRDDDTYLFDLDNRRRQFGRKTVHENKNSVESVSSSSNSQEHLEKAPHDGETYCIDARYYGNVSRFINHMCEPNLLAVRVFVDHQDIHFPRMAFFANRDIEPNEELGFDYGDKFWAVKCKSFTCSCGAENCKYSESTFKKTLNLSGASEQ